MGRGRRAGARGKALKLAKWGGGCGLEAGAWGSGLGLGGGGGAGGWRVTTGRDSA